MLASNLRTPHPLLRLNPSHACIKPAQTSPTPASEFFSYRHQTCTNLTHSCVWILLIQASKLHKPQPLLRLNPSQASIKTAHTSLTPASKSFSYEHQTCTNLSHSCIWILLMLASNLRKPHPPCVWIFLIQASDLHKPHPLLRLNPSHACTKSAHTSPTPASEFFSYRHQTCTNLTHSCVWILLIQASKLHKPQPLLRLNPSQASIKTAHTSLTPASKSFSYEHQTCTNLSHSCIWILLMLASNLRKPHPPCVWIFLIQASDLHKPHPLLRLNPSHACTKSAHTSLTPASKSFSYEHQTCTNLTHSCVWILLKQASKLHTPRSLLRLNPSHMSIKPAQISATLASESFSHKHQTCTNLTHPASESFSYKHQTCTNLTHSCVWILLMRAPNLHTPRSLLRLNLSLTSIKPAQISPSLASESFSCLHQTCAHLTHSCVWILLMLASNLRKPHPLLLLNSSHTGIKLAQTSPTPASESFSYKHQNCTNLNHSCVWILLMRSPNLHTPRSLLRLNPSHMSIKPAQISATLASESFSCLHQTCANLTHSCVWIFLMLASNLQKSHPLLLLNSSHTSIKPVQTSPTPASGLFSNQHQTCTNLTQSCLWILLIQASKLHKPRPLLRLDPSQTSIKPAQTSPNCALNPSQTSIKTALTSPTLATESFSCVHQTCRHLAHSCV